MKFALDSDDLAEIKDHEESDPICQFLNNRDKFRFSVGDILIKKLQHWNDENKWETEYINDATKMARRYVYIHENEHGVGFLKLLKVTDGELGKGLICMTDFIGRENVRFEVDPEFMDSVLFGDGEFDIKLARKMVREKMDRIKAIDEKARVRFENLKQANDFFENIAPGQKFWMRENYKNASYEEYTFEKLKKRKVKNLNGNDKYSLNDTFEKADINHEYAYYITYKDVDGDELLNYAFDFNHMWVYNNKPPSMEDEI